MAIWIFAGCFLAAGIGLAWLLDRKDAVASEHRRHWLRGDRWVLGKGWQKADQ